MRLSWPLIGRSKEMRAIRAAMGSSDVSGVVISGAEGVGKTRVARDALSRAADLGFETRWTAGASSARSVPLGAFAAWTPSNVADIYQLLRGVIEALTATSSSERAVLAVDDVHLLDDLSTFVVYQIVHRRLAKVILTIRDGEPISAATREIWATERFERIDLESLSVGETTDLLSASLSGPIDESAAKRLWLLTRGNVLFLQNIVEQEVDGGRLVCRDGWWRWEGDPVVPPGLVELIESRFGDLPAPVGDVLDVLAVCDPIELSVLTRVTHADAVEQAETRGLVRLESGRDDVQARVAHPLYAEVRRKRAPHTRLRRLRGRVARELAARIDAGDVRMIVRCATLSVESDFDLAADLLVRAAHGAVWLGDLDLADRLSDAAIRAGAGPEPMFVRAHALSWLGRGREAEAILATFRDDALTDRDRARFAFLRSSNALWALGDPPMAKKIIDAAAHTTPLADRVYVDAFLTVYWFAVDRPQEAVVAAKSVVLQDIPIVGAEIAWVLAQIKADAGRTTEAAEAATAGYAVVTRALDAPHMRFNIADAHVSALMLAGRISDAIEVAELTREQAADMPGAAQLLGVAVAGRAALAAGRVEHACAQLARSSYGLSASYPAGWGYRYRVALATALAIRGSPDDALVQLAELDTITRRTRLLDYERALASAWVAAGQGAVTEAITVALSAAGQAERSGRFAAEVLCLQTAVQFGYHNAAARLTELSSIVEGPRAGLAARFASALGGGDARELTTVSGEFERMGDLVAALDSAAHAALAHRRRGERGSALTCAQRAEALAGRSGASTPALRQASEPLPLTERETEVVMMLAEGMSNRDVAKRLTLSVRTVESHIYRAMLKTGTTCREELAALIPRTTSTTAVD